MPYVTGYAKVQVWVPSGAPGAPDQGLPPGEPGETRVKGPNARPTRYHARRGPSIPAGESMRAATPTRGYRPASPGRRARSTRSSRITS